jgi:hypothetical protein
MLSLNIIQTESESGMKFKIDDNNNFAILNITKFIKKNYPDIYCLGLRESADSGEINYKNYNKWGYLGAWAISEKYARRYGFNNVTLETFKQNPEIFNAYDQLYVILNMKAKNMDKLSEFDKYIGKKFHGIKITKDGLFFASHLAGVKGLKRYFYSKGRYNPADQNGIKLTDYLQVNSKKGVHIKY